MGINFKDEIKKCLACQDQATIAWHAKNIEPDVQYNILADLDKDDLISCVLAQHNCNIMLWHIEDLARRKDIAFEAIANCKFNIDKLNQQRNDGMEYIDACFVNLLAPDLPKKAKEKYNTESLGAAVDRLSILSLKIYHMDEQLLRTDVSAEHLSECANKATILRQQRADLLSAICDLIDDFLSGEKQPKKYFQFKMYNDPNLNPQLYEKKNV